MRPDEAEEMDAMDEKIGSLQCGLARAQKERDAARALVSELAKALECVIEPAEDVCAELRAMSSGCEEYVTSLYASIATARAALAKAKGCAS
jgi:hypothetical protein